MAFGAEFRIGPIFSSGPYLSEASFTGHIKTRDAVCCFAVAAKDRQHAACRCKALLWNLLPASEESGRWALAIIWGIAFIFSPFHANATLWVRLLSFCCSFVSQLFNHAGLQRTAVAVIGQELTHMQRWGQVQHHMRTLAGLKYNGKKKWKNSVRLSECRCWKITKKNNLLQSPNLKKQSLCLRKKISCSTYNKVKKRWGRLSVWWKTRKGGRSRSQR